MTDQTPLDEILEGTEPPPVIEDEAPQEAEQIAEEEPQGRPRDEKGRFASAKGEEESAPPAPDHIPIAALKDERAKRQALEAELQQMRSYFEQQQQQQPAPDRWEDPEGHDQFLINQAIAAAEARAEAKAVEAFNLERVRTAASEYRADKQDYEDVIGVFHQMVQINPRLLDEMQSSRNPAEFAYETAKLQVEIAQAGGLDGLINARMEAKMREQQEQYSQVQGRLPSSLPPTISTDRSVGARSGPAWTGPTPLSDLLR